MRSFKWRDKIRRSGKATTLSGVTKASRILAPGNSNPAARDYWKRIHKGRACRSISVRSGGSFTTDRISRLHCFDLPLPPPPLHWRSGEKRSHRRLDKQKLPWRHLNATPPTRRPTIIAKQRVSKKFRRASTERNLVRLLTPTIYSDS